MIESPPLTHPRIGIGYEVNGRERCITRFRGNLIEYVLWDPIGMHWRDRRLTASREIFERYFLGERAEPRRCEPLF